MKKLFLISLLTIFTMGCTSETQYGNCIGAFDKKDPKIEYKLSVSNLVIGIFFVEFVFPPILVFADETFCPVGNVK